MSLSDTHAQLGTKDLLTCDQLDRGDVEILFDTARALKGDPGAGHGLLEGRAVVLLFEKASLRTRLSFEVGVARLGGHAVYVDHQAQRLGERESLRDYARNLERWVDAIVARVHAHATVATLAREARIPVVNGLSDLEHPCQALADYLTLLEHRRGAGSGGVDGLRGARLAYVGDGNNVCHSLLVLGSILGVSVTAITPPSYEPDAAVVARSRALAAESGAVVEVAHDPARVVGHHAVYTDTWVSMGEEAETRTRLEAFAGYQVTPALMALAGPGAVFMHCLPAKRGREVADGVIDGAMSVVYDQAENRMHVQNALLVHLLAGRGAPGGPGKG